MINRLIYIFVVFPVSRLPFPVLYALSDFLCLVLFRLVGYRKEVVMNNLKNSFPEKSNNELLSIRKDFYHHFCDTIVESIKAFSISEKEANRRMTYSNTEVLHELAEKGKSIALVGGHYGNWELLAITISQQMPHLVRAFYTPLKNTFWDQKMKESRGRFGLKLISTRDAKEEFNKDKDRLTTTIFGADQAPRDPKKAYWLKFLNQETGVQFGAEKYAKEYNLAVVFGAITRKKRGYFNTEISLVHEEVKDLPYGRITESFSLLLEDQIKKEPRYYLWTHKKWKHKRPAD